MNDFFTLVKYNLINNLGLNKLNKRFNKNGKIGIGLLILIIYLIVLAFVTIYIFNFATIFHITNNDDYLFLLGITLSSILIFTSTLSQSNSYIFKTKDYENLISMPIKPKTIVLSKIIGLYIQNFIFNFTIMVGIIISFTIIAGFNLLYLVIYIIYIIFVPMFPIAFSSLISLLFGFIPFNKKARNILSIIFYIVIVILVSLGYFLIVNSGDGSDNSQVEAIFNGMSKFYFLGKFAYFGLFDYRYFLLFLGISIISFIFFATLATLAFNRLTNIGYLGNKKKNNNSLNNIKVNKNILATLYKKEMKIFFNIPVYVINVIVGPILSVIASILIIYNMNNLKEFFFSSFNASEVNNYIMILLSLIIILCNSATSSSSSSISIEGKSFWIIKSSPVRTKDILHSKALVNGTIVMPFAFISLIISYILIKPDFIYLILTIFLVFIVIVGESYFGLFANELLPKFDYDSYAKVIKQSGAVLLNMVFTFVFALFLFFVFIVLLVLLSEVSYSAIILISILLLLAIIYMIISVILVYTKGIKRYNLL